MTTFDRSQRQQAKEVAKKEQSNPTMGTVTQVYEHIGEDDTSNFEADVQILDGNSKPQTCMIENSGSGAIDIPEAGDKVIIDYRQGGKKPFITGTAYTTTDRPPVGTAGTYRRRFESRASPAGPGNLYLEANTSYYPNSQGKGSESIDKSNLKSKASVIRIAKREEGVADPTKEPNVPAKIEFYDSPYEPDSTGEPDDHVDGESVIKIALQNREDPATSGQNPPSYKAAESTWGMQFDMKSGQWFLVGPKGFGIQCNGDGTFTWHIKKGEGNMDFKEYDSDTGPLSL